jgi:hypothetical protein
MVKRKVIDVIILTVRIPADVPDRTANAICRTLESAAFMASLRRAVRTAVAGFPKLARVRMSLSR